MVTPMKTPLKKGFVDFKLFHPYTLYQVTQLLERREVWLELEKKECIQVQRDNKIHHLAVPILISQLKILSFHIAVGQGNKEIYKKELQFCS